MTTPAALVLAFPAAPATSSSEAAASLAMVATSSSNAMKPEGMAARLGRTAPQAQLASRRGSARQWPDAGNGLRQGGPGAGRGKRGGERALPGSGDGGGAPAFVVIPALVAQVRALKTEIEALRAERNAI